METMKILEKPDALSWDYDEEADVLYVSVGKPSKALGVDVGDGVVVMYNEKKNKVAGFTMIGFRDRLMRGLVRGRGHRPMRRSRRGLVEAVK